MPGVTVAGRLGLYSCIAIIYSQNEGVDAGAAVGVGVGCAVVGTAYGVLGSRTMAVAAGCRPSVGIAGLVCIFGAGRLIDREMKYRRTITAESRGQACCSIVARGIVGVTMPCEC